MVLLFRVINKIVVLLTSEYSTWFPINNIADVTAGVARCEKTFNIKVSNLNLTNPRKTSVCHVRSLANTMIAPCPLTEHPTKIYLLIKLGIFSLNLKEELCSEANLQLISMSYFLV